MEIRMKRWAQLGLGAAVVAGTLAGCAPAAEQAEAPAAAVADAAAPAEASEDVAAAAAGEGEGGIAIDLAATDSVVYHTALAVAEAHVLAARDAYAAGEKDAAAEMFAHPVSEVLFDLQPVLEARGVADFSDMFSAASGAVLAGESVEQINQRTADILATLKAAAAKAPEDGRSATAIAAAVVADQAERAVNMYRGAAASGQYEPYLDGYGFYKTAEDVFARSGAAIEAADEEAAAALREVLALLGAAYPSAGRQAALGADQSALTVAASKALLATGG
jgi:hypothetical protein